MNTEPCVSVPVELLQELRSCIIGFEADKACDMLPTDTSLERARDLIRSALDTPRHFALAAITASEPAALEAAE